MQEQCLACAATGTLKVSLESHLQVVCVPILPAENPIWERLCKGGVPGAARGPSLGTFLRIECVWDFQQIVPFAVPISARRGANRLQVEVTASIFATQEKLPRLASYVLAACA